MMQEREISTIIPRPIMVIMTEMCNKPLYHTHLLL